MNDLNCFNDRAELGKVGEEIVFNLLRDKGVVTFQPTTIGEHWVDMFAHSRQQDKFFCIEVKTKAKMRKFNATGINIDHLQDYLKLKEEHQIDVLLIFVDKDKKEIYCGWLSELMKSKTYNLIDFPNYDISTGKVLFPIEEMRTLKELTTKELFELNKRRLN